MLFSSSFFLCCCSKIRLKMLVASQNDIRFLARNIMQFSQVRFSSFMLGYLYRINCFLLIRTPTHPQCVQHTHKSIRWGCVLIWITKKKKAAMKYPNTRVYMNPNPTTAHTIVSLYSIWKTFCTDSFGLIFLGCVLLSSRMCRAVGIYAVDLYGIIRTLHFRDYSNSKRLQYKVATKTMVAVRFKHGANAHFTLIMSQLISQHVRQTTQTHIHIFNTHSTQRPSKNIE